MRKFRLPLIALLVISILLAACQSASPSGGQAQPTDIPPVVSPNQIVVDGRVVPADDVQLSFNTNGEVTDIRVKEGDVVKTGDVLASLGNRAQLESTLSSAKLQLLSAQQDLLTAQQGRQELFDTLPQDRTAALDELTKAKKALDDANKKTYSVSHPARDTDIQDAQASVTLLADKLDKAKDDFEPYTGKHVDNLQRAVYLQRLASAQRNYDDAVRRLNNLQGGASDFYRSQTDAEFQIAQERLAQAQKDFDKLNSGPDPDKLALFDSQISTAQGRIDAAQAAITAADESLKDLDLVATIDGTIVKLDLTDGQQVTQGAPVIHLADLSKWYVDTDNLTEIDVVNIAPGQSAAITPDALPDQKLTGTVESISNTFEEKRGDVTYTAHILLNDADPQLRWGMTTSVTFEKGN